MRLICTIFTLHAICLFFAVSCEETTRCQAPTGSWVTEDGGELYFFPEGKGLWITTFGRMGDTVGFEYRTDCKKSPPSLDLVNIADGPFRGKKLLGIIDWQSESAFRWRYEPGEQEELRPRAFDLEHTEKYNKR
jgi:hypothetical protein